MSVPREFVVPVVGGEGSDTSAIETPPNVSIIVRGDELNITPVINRRVPNFDYTLARGTTSPS